MYNVWIYSLVSAGLIDLVSDCFVALSLRQPLLVSSRNVFPHKWGGALRDDTEDGFDDSYNSAYKLTYAEVKGLNFFQPNARR